jgi:predicted transcriptional regulator
MSQEHPPSDRQKLFQDAYVLAQLQEAGQNGKPAGKLNKEMGAAVRRELTLDPNAANQIRKNLVSQGFLATKKTGRQVNYFLTESGRDHLAQLEIPVIESRKTEAVNEGAISEELRQAQKAFLLLQLLDAKERRLTKGEANRLPLSLQASLGMKPSIANLRRRQLTDQGLIRRAAAGRSEEYSLTSDGLDYLVAGCKHLDHLPITVHGGTLNTLVAAARESSFAPSGPGSSEQQLPSPTELTGTILTEFEELRREKYGRSGLVPIHEVRSRILERFGKGAARHDVFDEMVLELWRNGRIRITAISDLTDANEQQLNDSIRGEGQTLFYLESAHVQPAII